MAWLLDMRREEKEEYVIRLYNENKSIREIAKIMHMSFRDIGRIINRLKSEAERERGDTSYGETDTEPKSKQSQAFKLFSEGKTPVEVVIALDLQADQVQAIYREFWELNNMYELAEVYEEIRPYLPSFLRLHKILNDRRMGEQEIINVLELASNHQLQHLQWKVEYLRNEIAKSTMTTLQEKAPITGIPSGRNPTPASSLPDNISRSGIPETVNIVVVLNGKVKALELKLHEVPAVQFWSVMMLLPLFQRTFELADVFPIASVLNNTAARVTNANVIDVLLI